MLLLPYNKIIIKTKYSAELIHKRLLKKVNSKYTKRSLFENNDSEKEFFGNVDKRNFKIMRIIWYKNSFLPIIIGQIKEEDNGSTIFLRMRHTIFTLICMVIIFLITGHSAYKAIIGENSGLDITKSLLPFIFAYALFIIPYKIEMLIAHRILYKMFTQKNI